MIFSLTKSFSTAKKLAVIVWNMIAKTQAYLEPNNDFLTFKRKNEQIKNIKLPLFKLNLTEAEMLALFQTTTFPSA